MDGLKRKKNIEPEKFWKEENQYQTTYKLYDVHGELDKNRNVKIGCILIGCGINDIEKNGGIEVDEEIICLVEVSRTNTLGPQSSLGS